MMVKDLKIFTSAKKKNQVLKMFDIPYRFGKELGKIMIIAKKNKK